MAWQSEVEREPLTEGLTEHSSALQSSGITYYHGSSYSGAAKRPYQAGPCRLGRGTCSCRHHPGRSQTLNLGWCIVTDPGQQALVDSLSDAAANDRHDT